MSELKPLTEAETTELLDWVSACQTSYHIDSTPGHRFGGLGSNLQENRESLVEYVNELIAARAQPAQAGQVLALDEVRESVHEAGLDWHNGWTMGEDAENRYLNLCRAIEAAVLAKRVPQWLPISTAPMDGTEILLSNGETVAQGNWLHAEPYMRERRDIDGRYIDQDEFDGYDGWIDQTGGMQPDPTHWMPLPPPPGIVGEKGGA